MAPRIALVLSGGVALGAYQAGAYAALAEQGLTPQRLAGSSVGAVNAALIAGNPSARRVARLKEYWDGLVADPGAGVADWFAGAVPGSLRHAYRWMSVLQTRLFGRPGAFRPRGAGLNLNQTSLYDMTPMKARLETLIDFDRLNDGSIRLTVMTTDIETGQKVVFDTHDGDRIGPEHLLATCGFLP
jgi:NTE family protein